jgi:hypothetical protein
MRGWTRRVAMPSAVMLLVSCGGDRGSGPSVVTPPTTFGLPSGAVLTLVSGETGAAMAGASVTAPGGVVTSDAAGQVRLPAAAPLGASIEIRHPQALDRVVVVRAGTGQRFALWPRTTGTGLSEHYTATLVYTDTTDPPGPTGGSAMQRVPRSTSTVVVVPSAGLLEDGAAMEAHSQAVAGITEATGGTVVYALAPTRPAAGVVVTTRADPQDTRCVQDNIRGYTRSTFRGLELVSAEIVLCSMSIARTATIGHELGHTFGLRHSPDADDIMFFRFGTRRATTFGPRESLLMRLMLDRFAGNRFPDDDRGATASSARSERLTVCY